jgi:hypothetical protein
VSPIQVRSITFPVVRTERAGNYASAKGGMGSSTAEIAKSFWTNEELGGRLRLDSVVCVVDSRNVEKVSVSPLSWGLCSGS